MTHGWYSESTGGPKGGCSCVFWSGATVAVVTLPQLLDVVLHSAVAAVAVRVAVVAVGWKLYVVAV